MRMRKIPRRHGAKYKPPLIKIHRRRAAAFQGVIPETFYRKPLVTLTHMRGLFDIAFTVVSGEQHIVAELFLCNCCGVFAGGVEVESNFR
jgi:hypothetical protein